MKKIVSAIMAACMLSGCAEIAVPVPDSSKYGISDDLKPGTPALAVADYASSYAIFTKDVASELKYDDVIFDFSILTAALAAAGALYFASADVAPRAVAGAGLFAGGISAWRTRLSPKQAAALYEKTSRRMLCISRTLRPLASVTSYTVKTGVDASGNDITLFFGAVLAADLADLQGAEQNAEKAIAGATDSEVRKKGNDALTAAKAEITLASHLLAAIQNGGRAGLDEITRAEADLSSGLDTQSLDYASLETSLVNSIKAKAQNQADSNTAGSAPAPQGNAGRGAMAGITPDEIAKAATDSLVVEVGKTKTLTDRAAPAQDVEADLVSCRTTT